MKQAIIYCRFSPRPDAGNCYSNEKQEERCRNYCERQNYRVAGTDSDMSIGVFCDRGVSGKSLNRPGLNAAISHLKSGMILVVDSRDRLARDMLVSLTIHQRVKEKSATIEVADGSPSRETPEGNLMANILDAFAQYDRERFARRTKAGLAKKKANGEWLGKPPIGWRLDRETKKLEKEPREQGAIKQILFLHKSYGLTSGKIAKCITDGWGTYRGNPWSARTIRRILKREKHENM